MVTNVELRNRMVQGTDGQNYWSYAVLEMRIERDGVWGPWTAVPSVVV